MTSTFQLPGSRNLSGVLLAAIYRRKTPKHTFEGHQSSIWSFIFLQDNVHIVSGSEDGTMRKWNCETGLLIGEPWKGETPICSLALSPDGKTIGCGRGDGTVERWDTNGQMMKEIWTGHSDRVRSVSWSPSGSEIASGSEDVTILIRNAESGQLKLRPIRTNQGYVKSVAYSPSSDRIASGGNNASICIWDSHTGDLLVGPIEGLGAVVDAIVWSLDGSKLYSAFGKFARVLDSTSGTQLHRFKHDNVLYSIALSPTHNVLACVGGNGIAQLWDTLESHQPFGHRFHQENRRTLFDVSFSPDGRYLAYGGDDSKITLWSVKDIAPQLPVHTSSGGAEQETRLKSTSPDVHTANPLAQSAVDDVTQEAHDNPYDEFFASSQSSLPLPSSSKGRALPSLLPSPLHTPNNQSIRSHLHLPRRLFSHGAPSDSHSHLPANTEHTKRTPKGKCRAKNEDEEHDDIHFSANITPDTAERSNDKGKQRETPIARMQTTLLHDLSSPAELDNNGNRAVWKSLIRARKMNTNVAQAKIIEGSSPEIIDISACRKHQGYVAYKRKSKSARPTATAGGSLEASPSPQSISVAGDTTNQPSQVTGVNNTTDDRDSDSIIQGGCNIFLDKICFPCGRYEEDD